MVINLYLPEINSPGQDLAPSPLRRVASGSLSLISRRFFINQNLLRGNDRKVLLPNIVAKIEDIKSILQIKFLFVAESKRPNVKGERRCTEFKKTFHLYPFAFYLF